MTTRSAGSPAPGEVTRLLDALRGGDPGALDRLYPLVYTELRRAAAGLLRRERPGHTLQPTALVHEAYIKLADRAGADVRNRAHFFGVAARAMRQVLVDHARRRNAAKRGGGAVAVEVNSGLTDRALPFDELLALDDALERLGQVSHRLRQVVEYRFFGGLSEEEVAEVLGVTVRTAQRDWAKARAWLYAEVYSAPGRPAQRDEAEGTTG
jgi:RNA polymerase sigma factor (TIGR02999 family)